MGVSYVRRLHEHPWKKVCLNRVGVGAVNSGCLGKKRELTLHAQQRLHTGCVAEEVLILKQERN